MDTTKLKDAIVKVLADKNGGDVREIDIGEKSSVADFFVIATGKNLNHVKALAEFVEDKIAEEGLLPARKEGVRDGRWAVLDYQSVIVHIFNAESRDYFCLEKLWN